MHTRTCQSPPAIQFNGRRSDLDGAHLKQNPNITLANAIPAVPHLQPRRSNHHLSSRNPCRPSPAAQEIQSSHLAHEIPAFHYPHPSRSNDPEIRSGWAGVRRGKKEAKDRLALHRGPWTKAGAPGRTTGSTPQENRQLTSLSLPYSPLGSSPDSRGSRARPPPMFARHVTDRRILLCRHHHQIQSSVLFLRPLAVSVLLM
ncbi:hypothetical protein ACLOJK_024631 [Asimina triloba]